MLNKIITKGIIHIKKKFEFNIHWKFISLLNDFNCLKGSGGKITHIQARIIREGEACKRVPHTSDVGLHVNVAVF